MFFSCHLQGILSNLVPIVWLLTGIIVNEDDDHVKSNSSFRLAGAGI
ncbi:hypothetical protein GLYMA_08G320601v4 [Glycine max]|nr:hypothetical protein GLYMA_08G320601v4 [Glycine max]KAH1054136.1 hypothetical protein GYH30_023081 [Glycine max]